MVTTPNINSLGRRTFDKAWLHWDPPRHLYLYSTQTLRACVEASGFDIQELRTTSGSARWTWAASSLIRRDRAHAVGLSRGLGTWLRLQELAFWVIETQAVSRQEEAGEGLVMVAER